MRVQMLAGAILLSLLVPVRSTAQVQPQGSEFLINTYTPGVQATQAAAALADGGFVVVWTDGYGDSGQDGSMTGIFGQRLDGQGQPVGPEFPVNSYTTGFQAFPAVAAAQDGGFLVVWQDGQELSTGQDGSRGGIFGRRFDSLGAAVGLEFRVNTYTTGLQQTPAVAAGPAGGFLVVWEDGGVFLNGQDGSFAGIYGQFLDETAQPAGVEFRVNAYTTDRQRQPAVSAAPNGDYLVTWDSQTQADGCCPDIYLRRYSGSGAELGGEMLVNTTTADNQLEPALAVAPDGTFVVIWASYEQSGYDIRGRSFDAVGAAAGPDFKISLTNENRQYNPSVAAVAGGDFAVAWDSVVAGAGFEVFGRLVSRLGNGIGEEFRVNTPDLGPQSSPSAASGQSGDFLVVWSGSGPGDGSGVFGGRFSIALATPSQTPTPSSTPTAPGASAT